jgi:hypothetical protein
MCELVFLNHVNICGRILELTPKNGTNLSISNSQKILPDLTKLQHPQKGAVLILEHRWRDSCMSRARRLGVTPT